MDLRYGRVTRRSRRQRNVCLWYDHLTTAIKRHGFTVLFLDPCLLTRSDFSICIYVDDAILISKNREAIDAFLNQFEHDDRFDLTRKGDLAAYLGVQIDHLPHGSLHLSQLGLTARVIQLLGLDSPTLNQSRLPPRAPMGAGLMLPLLPANLTTAPPSACSCTLATTRALTAPWLCIHQCARYSNNPKLPHDVSVKHIGRYLLGILDKGYIIKPLAKNERMTLDCFCDADFAGLWNHDDANDPSCVKSRTGYLITL